MSKEYKDGFYNYFTYEGVTYPLHTKIAIWLPDKKDEKMVFGYFNGINKSSAGLSIGVLVPGGTLMSATNDGSDIIIMYTGEEFKDLLVRIFETDAYLDGKIKKTVLHDWQIPKLLVAWPLFIAGMIILALIKGGIFVIPIAVFLFIGWRFDVREKEGTHYE